MRLSETKNKERRTKMKLTKKQTEELWGRIDRKNAEIGAGFSVGEHVFIDNGFKEYLEGDIVGINKDNGRVSVLVTDAKNGGVIYANRKNPVEGRVITRTSQDIRRTIAELN
jgi:transcription antitermination factor NusG